MHTEHVKYLLNFIDEEKSDNNKSKNGETNEHRDDYRKLAGDSQKLTEGV